MFFVEDPTVIVIYRTAIKALCLCFIYVLSLKKMTSLSCPLTSISILTYIVNYCSLIYFRLEPPQVILHPRFVVIKRPGDVFYYSRLRIKTACRQQINKTCAIQLGSNVFTESELIFTDSNCGVQDEMLTSSYKIEMKNITANMSVVEHKIFNIAAMYTPQFTESTYSIVSCEMNFNDKPYMEMEYSKQNNDDDESLDDTNSAKKTIQRIGLLIVGICLFFVS